MKTKSSGTVKDINANKAHGGIKNVLLVCEQDGEKGNGFPFLKSFFRIDVCRSVVKTSGGCGGYRTENPVLPVHHLTHSIRKQRHRNNKDVSQLLHRQFGSYRV